MKMNIKIICSIFMILAMLSFTSAANEISVSGVVNGSYMVSPGETYNVETPTSCITPVCTIQSIWNPEYNRLITSNGSGYYYNKSLCTFYPVSSFNTSMLECIQTLPNQTKTIYGTVYPGQDGVCGQNYTLGRYVAVESSAGSYYNDSRTPIAAYDGNWSSYWDLSEETAGYIYFRAYYFFPNGMNTSNRNASVALAFQNDTALYYQSFNIPEICILTNDFLGNVNYTNHQFVQMLLYKSIDYMYIGCINNTNQSYIFLTQNTTAETKFYEMAMKWSGAQERPNPYISDMSEMNWLVTYNYSYVDSRYCSCAGLTKTTIELIPGIITLIILIGGCLPIVFGSGLVGKKETNLKLIVIGMMIIIFGLAILDPIADIILSTC